MNAKQVAAQLSRLPKRDFFVGVVTADNGLVWKQSKKNSDLGIGYSFGESQWIFVDMSGEFRPQPSLQAAVELLKSRFLPFGRKADL